MRGLKRKYFKGLEVEKRYRVPLYTLPALENELQKVKKEFKQHLDEVCHMFSSEDPLSKQQAVAESASYMHSWASLKLYPRIESVQERHTQDLKQYNGAFPWHKPITDPYIRQQFFLASKECFEMELETLRNMIAEVVARCHRRIKGVK